MRAITAIAQWYLAALVMHANDPTDSLGGIY